MGAWGKGNFENDETLDWLNEFLAENNYEAFLRQTLDTIITSRRPINMMDGSSGFGACEVIAALHGKPCPDVPEELTEWLETHSSLSVQHLLIPAIMTVAQLLGRESELRQLWVTRNKNEKPE